MKTRRTVELFATPSYRFFDGAGVLKGLSDLSRAGSIRLTVSGTNLFDHRHHGMIFFRVTESGKTRRVAIDLADRSDYFSTVFLRQVDVYVKRSFSKVSIEKSCPEHAAQIIPYGLSFPCLGLSAAGPHLWTAAKVFRHRLIGVARAPVTRAISEFVYHVRLLHALRPASEFERDPTQPAGNAVILQTRIWPPEPSVDNLETVNSERIAMVRGLKAAFGPRFVGGIVADEFSRGNCPNEALVEKSTHRAEYAKLVRLAGIGVYVRGLHGAIAIKMAEYLAAGLCIVSEPLKFELPEPLVEGVNYLEFRSPEECVARCKWLDGHPAEAQAMRRANRDYYRKHVEPRALVSSILARALAA